MNKFLLKSFVIFCIFCVIDAVFGVIGKAVLEHLPNSKTQTARTNYAINKLKTDCLIIGSSTAGEHYVPKIIEDEIGLSTYTAGLPGKGFAYMACVLNSVINRQTPKLVVFDLNPGIFTGIYSDAVNQLRPYKNNKYIFDALLKTNGKTDLFMLLSNLYCFNNMYHGILGSFISPIDDMAGFEPLTPPHALKQSLNSKQIKLEISDLELHYFNEIMRMCAENNIKLVVAFSPQYAKTEIDPIVLDMLKAFNATIIDNSVVDGLTSNSDIWYDSMHLCSDGAIKYSSIFANQLSELLN